MEDIHEDFEDVKYFAENKDFRRLELWLSGDDK